MITFDQLVYTSASTSMGKGYQVVAASPGISEEERAFIKGRSELRENLPSGVTFKGSLSFYHLGDDDVRTCVARTYPAGNDYVGRPGRRLTHAIVLGRDAFERLECDAFAADMILRDQRDKVMKRYSVTQDPPSDIVAPNAKDEVIVERRRKLFDEQAPSSDDGLTRLLSAFFSGRRAAVLAGPPAEKALEVALRALPKALRVKLTFSTFQLSRPDAAFSVVVVPRGAVAREELEEAEYLVVDLGAPEDAPAGPGGLFASEVARLLSHSPSRSLDTLHDLARSRRLDRSFRDLDKLARIWAESRGAHARFETSAAPAAAAAPRGDVVGAEERAVEEALSRSDWVALAEDLARGFGAGGPAASRLRGALAKGALGLLEAGTDGKLGRLIYYTGYASQAEGEALVDELLRIALGRLDRKAWSALFGALRRLETSRGTDRERLQGHRGRVLAHAADLDEKSRAEMAGAYLRSLGLWQRIRLHGRPAFFAFLAGAAAAGGAWAYLTLW